MTIKKRLFWSDILMLLVPVVITGLIGLLCIGFMWLTLLNGAGLRLRGPEDFDRVSRGVRGWRNSVSITGPAFPL